MLLYLPFLDFEVGQNRVFCISTIYVKEWLSILQAFRLAHKTDGLSFV